MADKPRLLIYIDGGAKGNPGPAGCAAVVKTGDDGLTVLEKGEYVGVATNNVAEYRGLLLGLNLAAQLKAEEIEIRSDSELLVFQMTGRYRVKNRTLQVLHQTASRALGAFKSVEIRYVPRLENMEADQLAHQVIREHLKHARRSRAAESPGRGDAFRLK